jgi:ribonucleotide reductase beta subunit family protein with ferritin-like domain
MVLLYRYFQKVLKNRENYPMLSKKLLNRVELFLTSTLTRQRTAEVFNQIRSLRNELGLWARDNFLIYLTSAGVSAYTSVLSEYENPDSLWLKTEAKEEYTKFLVAKTAKEILQSENFSSGFAYQLYLALENKLFPLLFKKSGNKEEK